MSVKQYNFFYEEPELLRKKIAEALKYYEFPEEINLDVLQEWISGSNSPLYFITRVFQGACIETDAEAEKLLDLLSRLWNITPRNELGGVSPQQKMITALFKPQND